MKDIQKNLLDKSYKIADTILTTQKRDCPKEMCCINIHFAAVSFN